MPYNGSGSYTLPVNSFNPAVAATTINPTDWNSTGDDLETALSTAICKDGQTTTTARIPFASGISTDSITEVTSTNGVTIAKVNAGLGADIASAGTINLTTATGQTVDVTGTTTITAITLGQGSMRWVRFTGILTLTNGASLVLPGAANITTAAGDYALFIGYASSVVRCAWYQAAAESPVTGYTGTGLVVRQTSPTLITPTLGVASATSINKVALTAPASGSTLTIADGKTLTASNSITIAGTDAKTLTVSNSLTLAGTDSTTMTFPPASASVGYLNLPVNSQSTAYTTVLADSGKMILHPAADTNARTFTIAANASVAYDTGTVITFLNETANVVTIAINSDTLVLAGSGSTGSRSLAQWGLATAVKKTSTSWLISGSGIT